MARAAATPPVYLGTYRFLLAILVFSSHSTWGFARAFTRSNSGPIGVMCFLVVSGFLITSALEDHYAGRVDRFLVNRFLRIYPTLWASLIVAVVVILSIGPAAELPNFHLSGWSFAQILRCILIVPAYPEANWAVLPVGWTLQVEVTFYLVIAGLYLLVGRAFRPGRHVVVLLSCAAVLAGYVIAAAGSPMWWTNPVTFTPLFVLGVATALFVRIDPKQRGARATAVLLIAASLLLCINLVMRFSSDQFIAPFSTPLSEVLPGAENGALPGSIVTFVLLITLFLALLAPAISARVSQFATVDNFLGDLTYPLYTLHFASNQLIAFWIYKYLGKATVLVQLPIAIAAAYLMLKLIDKPMTRLRTRIRGVAIR